MLEKEQDLWLSMFKSLFYGLVFIRYTFNFITFVKLNPRAQTKVD